MTDIKSYHFNEVEKILDLRTKGVMKVGDVISHYEYISEESVLPRKLKVLIDCRGTCLDLRIADIELTQDAVKKALENFLVLREAIVVDKPYETVIATMFDRFYSKVDSYSMKVFSTLEAAKAYLQMSY